ncbi:hypothetical protein P0F65_07030 [Sphingomonas sp. I4]
MALDDASVPQVNKGRIPVALDRDRLAAMHVHGNACRVGTAMGIGKHLADIFAIFRARRIFDTVRVKWPTFGEPFAEMARLVRI